MSGNEQLVGNINQSQENLNARLPSVIVRLKYANALFGYIRSSELNFDLI